MSQIAMSDIKIIINGGNNLILPNVTNAVLNFYSNGFAEQVQCDNALIIYIIKENVPHDVVLMGEGNTATNLACVVMDSITNEPLGTQNSFPIHGCCEKK